MFNFGAPAQQKSNDGSLDERRAKFAQSLIALNDQFLSWVQEQNKDEVWTDGVEDYLTYAKQLLKDYDDVVQSNAGPSSTAFGAGGSGSAFGRLGTAPTSTGAAAPSLGFNFAPSGPAPTFGGFGGVNGSAADKDDDEDEENEEEEAGPSLELDSSTADILLSHRVKLMSQNIEKKKWTDRGNGLVSIRRSKESPGSPYIVFTTDAGRVLLNAPLVKDLKPVAKPPATVIMMLISRVSPDEPEERGLQLFKFDSGAVQTEFMDKIAELLAA